MSVDRSDDGELSVVSFEAISVMVLKISKLVQTI